MQALNTKPSEKSIYIWNLLGSMANALISVVVLMIVTRTTSSKQADIFSIAWSIAQLMLTIGTFQIRTYQATDVTEKFTFKQYLIFRMLTTAIMILSSIIYVVIQNYELYKATVVVVVCLFRAFDALADVFEGWFQQKERLDLAGKSLTYRVIACVICFGIVLVFTNNLLLSCFLLLLSNILCFLAYDIRYYLVLHDAKQTQAKDREKSWLLKLTLEGLPIFFNAFLMMSIMNTPKMVIDSAISQGQLENGAQTIFNILFMPASVLTLVYVVFRPLLTRMALMWTNHKTQEFLKIVFTIILCLLGMTVLLIAGCAILGIPFLSLLYGIDLDKYGIDLLIIVAGGCFCTFSYVLDNALVVMRRQYLLIVSYVGSWIYIKAVVSVMVERWKMLGAAMAYTTSMAVFFLVTAVIFSVCVRKRDA